MAQHPEPILPGAAPHHVPGGGKPFREIDVEGRKKRRLPHATLYYAERQAPQNPSARLETALSKQSAEAERQAQAERESAFRAQQVKEREGHRREQPRGNSPSELEADGVSQAESFSEAAAAVELEAAKRFRKTVLVIYNGGTIGMAPEPKLGGELAPMKGYLTHQMLTMSDLTHPSIPFFDVLEYDKLIDSSDMSIEDWGMLLKDIERFYFEYDAFVIAHGTDTMHYTACALAFGLRNLAKPVIITGSMVPLQEVYNDARRNIKMSLLFAGHAQLCEVCICFNDVLLRGTRATKINDNVAAFESPNFSVLGRVTSAGIAVNRDLLLRQPRGALRVSPRFSDAVLCLTVTPGDCLTGALSLFKDMAATQGPAKPKEDLTPEQAAARRRTALAKLPVQVLILRLAGGDGGAAFPALPALKKLAQAVHAAGCLMVLTSSAPHGGFSRVAREHIARHAKHVLLLRDMTAEAATVKAMYVIAHSATRQRIAELMDADLRGEVTTTDNIIESHL